MVMFMYLTALIIVRKGKMNSIYYYHTGQHFLNSNYITIHYHFSKYYFFMTIVIYTGNYTLPLFLVNLQLRTQKDIHFGTFLRNSIPFDGCRLKYIHTLLSFSKVHRFISSKARYKRRFS